MDDLRPSPPLPETARPGAFSPDLDVLAFLGLAVVEDPALPRPRFGDDVWDLSALADIPAYARVPGRLQLRWDSIAQSAWRRAAKEAGLALLQPAVGLDHRLAGARRRRLPPHDLARQLSFWRRWFDWLEASGIPRLAQVTQDHCDAWLTQRRAQVEPTTVRAEIMAIRHLADYGPLLSADAFPPGFRPWGSTSATAVAGCRPRGENTTPVIPDEVFGPLLAGALFLVQVAGPDVAAARAEWAALAHPARQRGSLAQRLDRHLDALAAQGRGLPALHPRHLQHQRARGLAGEGDPLGEVNLALLERQVATYRGGLRTNPAHRARLVEALGALGCEPGGLATSPAEVVDPTDPRRRQRWHRGFSPFELEDLVSLVVTASYVVVAALSGLRYSELAEMRRGCVRAEELAAGKLRHRIEAKVIKGRPLGGEVERWSVVAEVAQAFAMVERLIPDDAPFARLSLAARYPALRRWVNGAGQAAFLAPIPPWALNARQFRRTLARLLGFRPHGVVAAKIHLKHISVATSEGYFGRPGSSAAAFLAEVEAQTAQAQAATTRELYDLWVAGEAVRGPGRAELEATFAAIAQEMAILATTVIDSERRLTQLLARRAGTLHVGTLNHCWFIDPARARCLQGTDRSSRGPSPGPRLGMCEPTRCANATIHPQHVVIWTQAARDLDRLLASDRVPAQEKQRLEAERRRIGAVIAAPRKADGHGH